MILTVTDMDFKIAPEILQALQKVLNHGIFGYSTIPLEYYESIMQWWQTRYNFIIQKEWILYSTGVMPAISSIIRTLCLILILLFVILNLSCVIFSNS